MVHGHPSNQGVPGGGQPGVTMGQQMHPGMAGPGGPPVSQAGPMIGGMMQAGGPPGVSGGGVNAHAMSHLTPHQSQMFTPPPPPQQQQQISKSDISFQFKHTAQAVDDGVLTLGFLVNHDTANNGELFPTLEKMKAFGFLMLKDPRYREDYQEER